MRIDLKCGEYLDFYDIKLVEVLDYEIIKIKGNFGKGKRSITHQTHVEAIKNIKEVNRFLKKEMKRFDADGVCPNCSSLKILELGTASYVRQTNNPKGKIFYKKVERSGYKCEGCKKVTKELKPIDLVIYYK